MADLDPAQRAIVEPLRALVLGSHPRLTEHVKWNSPSYVLHGEDRITVNVRNKAGRVQLVLHMGATRTEDKSAPPVLADDEGLVSWRSDTRGLIGFNDLAALERDAAAIGRVVARWLALEPR